ncbi:MAG TPA: phosphoribosylamine--glycine ligase [Sphaerochaetaceae bacterium]|jgi:phosphoribosylamine--glycine ligase|nr:phosphoribosylamine--glycine ligase [Sphaerochaetaceae bacterium]
MRVLVLGSGAKDHAMTWLFSQSKLVDGLYVAQGNIGTAAIAENLPTVDPSSPESVYAACREHNIQFVFVGTEAPLFTGVIDYLNNRGIDTFGAPGNALKLEGDRYFARTFTARHNIPTPPYKLFSDEESLSSFLYRHAGESFVLKRNAMAPSRIMVDSNDYETLMEFGRGILKTDNLLVENHLDGLAVTITVFTDNNGYLMLPLCSDYTRSEEGGSGAATGGMGSICPVPLPKDVRQQIIDLIIEPTLYGMQVEQFAYRGVLTFSVILTASGPVLVDYHVRFNDPATQAIVPLIKSDIIEILNAMRENRLNEFELCLSTKSAVSVVVASQGYPDNPKLGEEVKPLPNLIRHNLLKSMPMVFYGAVMEKGGKAVTTGGRNVTVVGIGQNIIQANKQAYQYIDSVEFNGAWYRKDIGNKFFED